MLVLDTTHYVPRLATQEEINSIIPVFAKRVDMVTDTIFYKGWAEVGSTDSELVWRIAKVTISGEIVTTLYANGNADFVNSWDNRATYTFS